MGGKTTIPPENAPLSNEPLNPDSKPSPMPISKQANDTKTSNNPVANAAMKETRIPINLVLLILLTSLGILARKK